MSIHDRGFASMDKTRQREIASMGGRAAQATGKAHRWNIEEARKAGRRGGMRANRLESSTQGAPQMSEPHVVGTDAPTPENDPAGRFTSAHDDTNVS